MQKHANSIERILATVAITISMMFTMAFKDCENGTPEAPADGTVVANDAEFGSVVGKWYYMGIISPDGTVRKLNNKESYFLANDDGRYENNFGHYPNWSQTKGKYNVKGSQLTLIREDGDRKVYEISFNDESSLTLKSADGGGYQLERE